MNQQRSGERKGSLSLAVSLLVRFAEFPAFMPPCGVLLAKSGRFGKSHFMLRRIVFPPFAPLLGCVKWQKQHRVFQLN